MSMCVTLAFTSLMIGFLPGFYFACLHFGFLLAMLAAIIERPFLRKAGIERAPLAYSIVANTISYFVLIPIVILFGICRVPVLNVCHESDYFLFAIFAPIGLIVAIVVKVSYLESKKRDDCRNDIWLIIFVANVVSAGH